MSTLLTSLIELDRTLLLALNFDGGGFLDELFWLVSRKWTWIPLYLFVIWLIYRKVGWKQTLLAVVLIALAVVVTDQIANLFKHYTPKLRPSHTPAIVDYVHIVHNYRGGWYGTVSAHAATTFSIALISSAILRRRVFTICMICWALFVAYSRIYLGVHFPLDILCGILDGTVVSLFMIWLYNIISRRWHLGPPISARKTPES